MRLVMLLLLLLIVLFLKNHTMDLLFVVAVAVEHAIIPLFGMENSGSMLTRD
jgi:hypothetical protein